MSGMINTIIVIGGLIGVYMLATGQRIPYVSDWLDQIFKNFNIQIPTGGGGGGGDATGGNLSAGGDCSAGTIFQPKGKTAIAKDSGKTKRNYASGGSSATTQWDIKSDFSSNVVSIEATLFCEVQGCGDEISIKFFGPDHQDGACCWLIMDVNTKTGKFTAGGEGPHPNTSKTNFGSGGSMGNLESMGVVGIKAVAWIDGSGVHLKGYGKVGNQWKEFLSASGSQFGDNKKASKPASKNTVQFRIDCKAKIHCASATEVNVTGSGSGNTTPTATPATNTTTTTKKSKSKSNYTIVYGDGSYIYNPTDIPDIPVEDELALFENEFDNNNNDESILEKIFRYVDDLTPNIV